MSRPDFRPPFHSHGARTPIAFASAVCLAGACIASAIARPAAAQSSVARTTSTDTAASAAGPQRANSAPLNTIVVTAARQEQALKDAPVATEVITRAEIQRTGASDLASVLTQQIGISPASGTPSGSGVILDGLGQERVLVLLDGEPIEGRLSGTFDLSRIPTSIIDHVEIVRGPQSMLYGSDAMGGVINIITRPAAANRTTASAEVLGGTQGRLDASVQASGGSGPFAFSGDVGHRDLNLTPGLAQSSGGYARRWDGLATMRWAPDSSFSLTTSALMVDENQQFASAPTAFLSNNVQLNLRESALWRWGSDGTGRTTQRFAPSISYSEFNHLPSAQGDSSGTATGEDEHEVERLMKGDFVYTGLFGAHSLTAGIDAQREEFRSDRLTGGDQAVSSFDPFVEGTIILGSLSVVPGVRLTDNQQWGTHWTPRLALLYRPIDPLAIRLSASTGFRSPDLEEQHLDFVNTEPGAGYEVLGNPSLQPESSRNLSLSFEWTGSSMYARVEGFETQYTNFIDYNYVGMDNGLIEFTYGNVDDGEVHGVNFTGGIVAGHARVDFGYGLSRTTSPATSAPLLGIPGATARVGASYTMPFGVALTITGLYTGSTQIGSADGSSNITQGAFTRINVVTVHRLSRGWQVVVGADNLLNAQPLNWPEASARRIYGGLRWNLVAQ